MIRNLFVRLMVFFTVASGFAAASCSFQGDTSGSGPVTAIKASGSTGFDITLASSSHNYTLYRGNPSLWGNLQPGGYVEYRVSVQKGGTYGLQAYYSSAPGARPNLLVNGSEQGAANLASTGSWGNMVLSAPTSIYLPTGESTIEIAAQSSFEPFNLAGLLVTPEASAPAPQPPPSPSQPTPPRPPDWTSRFSSPPPQAAGAMNVSGTSVTGFNIALDSNSGGYTLYPGNPATWGNLQPGGFVEYKVNAPAGNFGVRFYYATAMNGGASITVNGAQQQGALLPNTGSWNSYRMNNPVTLSLPAGVSVIRIAAQEPFSAFNLEGMTLTPMGSSSAPSSPTSSGSYPLANTAFYVNPYSEAALNHNDSCGGYSNPNGLIPKIAAQPQGVWFGSWNSDVRSNAASVASAASSQGKTPIMIAYNIPIRDCNGYSGGGATSAGAYQGWIEQFAMGIGQAKAVVILEPDALMQLYAPNCLQPSQQQERLSLLSYAVTTLKQNAPNASVYIDAGRAGQWEVDPADMGRRLEAAGVSQAAGFSLNVSNYISTSETTTYGQQISSQAGGKHFVIDTSRNGLGADGDLNWCNPPGRGLGAPPQGFSSGLTDAYLWVQNPGTSDGSCNGAPPAGQFSVPIACTLANNAIF